MKLNFIRLSISVLACTLGLLTTQTLQSKEPSESPKTPLTADKDQIIKALTLADDARVAAFIKPEAAKLNDILSDDLHYAHSNGLVDTKESIIKLLEAGATKYVSIDYETRDFQTPAPGIALMTGRSKLKLETAKGPVELSLSFLAVWREEGGQWKFLAWQSCKLPVPETK